MAFSLSDILSAFPDADPSKVSAHVTASGGEASSASLKLSVSAEDGAITSSAIAVAEVDDQKVETTASAEAAGETASTLLDLQASIEEQDGQIVAESSATANAEGVGDTTTAVTHAEATGFDQVVITQSPAGGETTEDGWQVTDTGDNASAESFTYLETVPIDGVEADALQLTIPDQQIGMGWTDVDWLL